MATFAQIKTKVQRRVIDLPASVTAEVPELVKRAHKRLQERHNFQVMRTEQAENTTLSTRVLAAVPTDFKELILDEPPYARWSAGQRIPLGTASSESEVHAYYENDDEGPPRFLVRGDPSTILGVSNWEIWPLPDGNSDWTTAPSGEYRIKIPYWKFLPALSADGDEDWFTINGEYYIINHATAEAFALNWDTEHETEWLGLAETEFVQVRKIDVKQMLSMGGGDTLIPYRGAKAPRLRWR